MSGWMEGGREELKGKEDNVKLMKRVERKIEKKK